MVIRIHKRTIAIFLLAILTLCALPALPFDEAAEASKSLAATDWGLSFREAGKPPVTDVTAEYLSEFDAHYIGDEGEKIIYLTFDAGYENGNTPKILDALKKHNAPATFFLVGNFLEREPELVRRMVKDGHTVGNHTANHPDMSAIADIESFKKELSMLEEKYEEITGEKMKKLYRPPQGKFSESNLRMAKELGYETFFWSLAYVDWQNDKQPKCEDAKKLLCERIHPGAVVLLHSTSATNGEILDDLLSEWERMGYKFGDISEIGC